MAGGSERTGKSNSALPFGRAPVDAGPAEQIQWKTRDPNMAEMMDTIIKVDRVLCGKCGGCARVCPGGFITRDDEDYPVPIEASWELCIDCGHCVSVCPKGAMHQRTMQPAECDQLDQRLSITWDQANQFLRSRRSIRSYLRKPVEKEKLTKLLEVAAYAPSGHNHQPARWLVIGDWNEVRKMAGLVIEWMEDVAKKQPELAKSSGMEPLLDAWKAGDDRILRSAPHLIVGYARKGDRTGLPAITIAIAHIQLAAPALGLGTCWAGYFNAACQSYPGLQQALSLPEGYSVFGSFMVGYPDVKYRRVPKRHSVDVVWR